MGTPLSSLMRCMLRPISPGSRNRAGTRRWPSWLTTAANWAGRRLELVLS